MPELFIELFSEEIPARMQKRAEEDLLKLLREKLEAHGLAFAAARAFSGPRRLGASIAELASKAADVNEEKKGPRVGAPAAAIQGFLKSAGLASIEEAQLVDDKKGAYYVARIARPGAPTPAILQQALPEIIRQFPWPKSMRSGSSDLQWVRPLHNICCVFDGREVKIDVAGAPSEAATWGHRFHAPAKIAVTGFDGYERDLRAAKVAPLREDRKRHILRDAKQQCEARGFELVEDQGLLEEVAGLAEWPQVIFGDMDPAFLDLPSEVIRLSMRTHQKYFAVRDARAKTLAPHFIAVANIEAKDGGKAIAAGNTRVLSARLNDARFFWRTDRKTPLYTEERKAKLEKIVFHQKLGSVWDKVERVRALALELCAVTGADAERVVRAADLCKMDLVTETVGEFPELQGWIGRELAATGEHDSVAIAIEDHYRPLGPSDRAPTDKVAVTLALADKLDTLVAFFMIDERPTGSSDPYALRRTALGLVRVVLQQNVRLPLRRALRAPYARAAAQGVRAEPAAWFAAARSAGVQPIDYFCSGGWTGSLLAFLADRLKAQLREQGNRHDLVDAVFALGDDDLVRIVARIEALDAFLQTEAGANLQAGAKRAANILAAEEKKGKGLSQAELNAGLEPKLLAEPAEQALYAALETALPAARAAVEQENFAAAMTALSALRAPVDAFFERVLVNAEDALLRRNRLLLLSRLREALSQVADFSKIEG
jgi:glycyl-tRNA synthetase beta chain